MAFASLWTGFLLVSLLVPGDSLGGLESNLGRFLKLEIPDLPGLDKIVHALLFAGETFFLCLCLRALDLGRPLAAAFISATFLAVLTEVGQLIVPFREADWADFVANQVGIALSALLIMVSSQHNPRGSHP